MYKNIVTEVDAGVGIITLNREDRRNAFDDVTIQELVRAIGVMGRDEGVRVVVLSMSSPRPRPVRNPSASAP